MTICYVKRRRVLRWLLLLHLSLFTISCNNKPSSAPSQLETSEPPVAVSKTIITAEADEPLLPGTVTIITASPVSTLDPYLMSRNVPESSLAVHVWDTLTWLDEKMEVQPGLAVSWRLVNDVTWELKLREDVVFHNGEPFDATAVAFSLERARTLPGSLVTIWDDASLQRVEIVDAHTVRLHTREPVVEMAYYLTRVEMLSPGYYGQTSASDVARQAVGSGPYRLAEWSENGEIVLTANDNYWQGEPNIQTLIYRPGAELEQSLVELPASEAVLVAGLGPEQAIRATERGWQLEAVESTRRLFIGIKTEADSPLTDARVRQALNYAVDVDAISGQYLGGYGHRYGSWLIELDENDARSAWPYDPDRARELLAEAGYHDGFQTILDAPTGRYQGDEAAARAIAEQLAQVGVRVTVQTYDWATYVRERLVPGETSPLFLLGLNSRGNDLEDLSMLSLGFPFNPLDWRHVEFAGLVNQASRTFNQQRKESLLAQANELVLSEAPIIFLWRQYDFYVFTPNFNWSARPDGLIYLYNPLVPTPETAN